MIVIDDNKGEVEELVEVKEQTPIKASKAERPFVLNAKVYKLKSGFVDYAIYITLTYMEEEGKKRPFEIFINSKDLTRSAEYAVLTRLISAIFRRSEDPSFILEELKSIYDPNGGYFKDGKYVPSIYAEFADVLEKFFIEIGLIKEKKKVVKNNALSLSLDGIKEKLNGNSGLKICPKCNQRTLKLENGCITCINPECNYSKCD